MNINLDAAVARSAAAGGPERRVPEARQAKWLSELERALFESGINKHGGGQPSGLPAPQAFAGPALVPQDDAALAPPSAGRTQAPPSAGRTQAPDLARTLPQHREAASTTADAPAAARPALAGSQDHAVPAKPVTPIEAHGKALPPVAALDAAAVAGGLSAAPNSATLAAAPIAAMPGVSVTATPSTAAIQPVAIGAMAARPVAAMAPALPESAQQPEPAATPDDAPHSEAGGAVPLELEAYARNAMHVYRSSEGVQAWIRDASLQPLQAEAVRRALAAELNRAGEKLVAVTINGRKLAPIGERDGHDGSADQFEKHLPEHLLTIQGAR